MVCEAAAFSHRSDAEVKSLTLSEPRYKSINDYISQINVLNFYMNIWILFIQWQITGESECLLDALVLQGQNYEI